MISLFYYCDMENIVAKDFDSWNLHKKNIHQNGVNKYYSQQEIWWCSLGTNIGFEEDGSGFVGERPVLILRGFNRHICLMVPLTTAYKHNEFYLNIGLVDGRVAFAIISQIRLIDTKRLINKLGVVSGETFLKIRKAVRDLI